VKRWALRLALAVALYVLPPHLVGALYAVVCQPVDVALVDGAVEVGVRWLPEGIGATAIGRVILYEVDQDRDHHRPHEHVHVSDCDKLGVLIFPAYGIAALISHVQGTGWHWGNYWEVRARRISGR
jgi:hypothetical protein